MSNSPLPVPEQLSISIRNYSDKAPRASLKKDGPRRRKVLWPSAHVIVFDCETTTDRRQTLRFGTYQHRETGALLEAGAFYAEDLPSDELELLKSYCEQHGLAIRSRESFVKDVLYAFGYELRGTIVGFNLPFDLARIAVKAGIARRSMFGGFSLTASEDKRLPSIQVKHVSRRFSLIRFAAPYRKRSSRSMLKRNDHGPVHRGFFVDVSSLGAALFARTFTLGALARHLSVDHPKLDAGDHGAALTREYVEYALRDTQTTWECFEELVTRYERLKLSRTPVHAIYSEASLGKAYLDAMGIKPWREVQPDFPPRLISTIMGAYFGGRSEVRIRREVREVIHCDFLSMYPTVCTLMGLWSFVTAQGMTWQDDTEAVRHLLEEVTLETLQDPAVWRDLPVLVEIKPDADILPVRARYEDDRPSTIGLNFLAADEGLWFTLADCMSAKLLNGRSPNVLRAIRFAAGERQFGLKPVAVDGNSSFRVDPRKEDFFKRVIELRRETQDRAKLAPNDDEREALKTAAQSLKIVANATSYGGFVELNVQEHSKTMRVQVHGATDEPFEHSTHNEERPGRFYHPLLATLITGAARLMLAMTERLIEDQGLEWAFCDTDSMSIAKPAPMEREDFRARVGEIVKWFETLNPYSFPGSILKIEDVNFSISNGALHEPLYSWCVSAKRYALFNIGAAGVPIIRKASAHGLGHLIAPYDGSSPSHVVPQSSAALHSIGVELWQHDLWWQIVRAGLSDSPNTVDLNYHPALQQPAVGRYGATSPRLLKWFSHLNKGRSYIGQVKPFGFMYSLFGDAFKPANIGAPATQLDKTPVVVRPIAPFDKSLTLAVEHAFDRESGASVPVGGLQTFSGKLAQYHLQPESKFSNGDYIDRGTTRRRHIRVSGVELIGKEANRWEEQDHLGIFDDAEVTYGSVGDPNTSLSSLIRDLSESFKGRDLSYRLGWSRSRLSKIAKGAATRLSRSTTERAMRALARLAVEAKDTNSARERVRAELQNRIDRDGLAKTAAALQLDASNLLKIARGLRRPPISLMTMLGGCHGRF